MVTRIESATCCSCGTPVVLTEIGQAMGFRWQAHCPNCYDPVDDAPHAACVIGWANTAEDALWAWQEMHDVARGVEWVPCHVVAELEDQVNREAKRQLFWVRAGSVWGSLQ